MSTAAAPSRLQGISPGDPPFSHQLAIEAGVARLSFDGELDLIAQPRLVSALDRCTSEAALVIVDLRAVDLLSRSALQRLIAASRRKRAMGGRLVVVRGRGTVQQLFERVGVTLDLEVVDTPPASFQTCRATDRQRTDTDVSGERTAPSGRPSAGPADTPSSPPSVR